MRGSRPTVSAGSCEVSPSTKPGSSPRSGGARPATDSRSRVRTCPATRCRSDGRPVSRGGPRAETTAATSSPAAGSAGLKRPDACRGWPGRRVAHGWPDPMTSTGTRWRTVSPYDCSCTRSAGTAYSAGARVLPMTRLRIRRGSAVTTRSASTDADWCARRTTGPTSSPVIRIAAASVVPAAPTHAHASTSEAVRRRGQRSARRPTTQPRAHTSRASGHGDTGRGVRQSPQRTQPRTGRGQHEPKVGGRRPAVGLRVGEEHRGRVPAAARERLDRRPRWGPPPTRPRPVDGVWSDPDVGLDVAELLRADATDLAELVDAREPAVRGSPVEDALGQYRPDARERVELVDGGRVEVHECGTRAACATRCGDRSIRARRRRPADRPPTAAPGSRS